MSNATHDLAQEAASQREVIVRSPAWATESTFDRKDEQVVDVTHTWTTATEAKATPFERPEMASVQVLVYQNDHLVLTPDGIHLVEGKPRVWIPDADLAFPDTAEARRLARGLIEACELIEGANGAQS